MLEMRPALEGYAGIPKETRLLFRGLRMLPGIEAEGMIQSSHRILAKGTSEQSFFQKLSEARKINRYGRVVISVAERPYETLLDRVLDVLERRLQRFVLLLGTLSGTERVRLTKFRSRYFEDFLWRALFAKTLPPSDFKRVTAADQWICSTPWHTMHMVGLSSLNVLMTPAYPRLETKNADIFIAQTPYPGRISKGTTMVVRYHDALPVLMPHTVSNKSVHQATHFYALLSNVRSGAYFACVSEATRRDLLSLFPEVESRAVTIHNMVSHHYHLEESSPELVVPIIRTRLNEGDPGKAVDLLPKFFGVKEKEAFYRRCLGKLPLRYLLVVCTVEPRKNHGRLLAAWEALKSMVDPELKLVMVGDLGWDYDALISSLKAWIDRGELFMLKAVPSPDLRVLYQHAAATVCPSLGEGFDFSGVEAMRSGGVVIASDIAVHREIYDDAAEYFDPYSTAGLVGALKKVLYSPDSAPVRAQLRERGQAVAERYLPERILPEWERFLGTVRAAAGARRGRAFAWGRR